MATRGPQNGHFEPLLLNKFFDPSTPSMRKGRDGGEKKSEKVRKENNGGNSGHYVVASRPPNGDRLQRRRSCQLMGLMTSHPGDQGRTHSGTYRASYLINLKF